MYSKDMFHKCSQGAFTVVYVLISGATQHVVCPTTATATALSPGGLDRTERPHCICCCVLDRQEVNVYVCVCRAMRLFRLLLLLSVALR